MSKELPPSVRIDRDTKVRIRDGLGKVIDGLRNAGAVPDDTTYEALMSDPERLYAFVEAFSGNREMFDEFIKDADGQPVRDNATVTECGVSLAQIERLLVLTCAKHFFSSKIVRGHRIEERQVRHMLVFKKTVQVKKETKRTEAQKFERMKEFIGFAWQLPLLEVYRDQMTSQHIMEVGQDLSTIRNPDSLRTMLQYDPYTIKKAKLASKSDFYIAIDQHPEAIPGIAVWTPDKYPLFRKLFKDRLWEFFKRDSHFFNAAAGLDKTRLTIYGDLLATIAVDNLMELERLNLDRVKGAVMGLREAFEDDVYDVLAEPKLATSMLHKMVDSFIHMKCDEDQFKSSAALTIKAVADEALQMVGKDTRHTASGAQTATQGG